MYKSNQTASPSIVTAIVISVDVRRKVCKVMLEPPHSQLIRGVPWYAPVGDLGRSGDSFTPMPRDRVYVSMAHGSACIVSGAGFNTYDKPFMQFIANRREVDDLEFYQKFNLTNEGDDKSCGTARPEDSQPGDRIITSEGGAMLGVLNSGSILAKASSLAQIFVTKLDDLVRIVSRNFERFTDASKRVDANVVGDVYVYQEYYRTQGGSRKEEPAFYEALGNTRSALSSRGDYVGQMDSLGINDIVRFQALNNETTQRWSMSQSLAGTTVTRSNNEEDTVSIEESISNDTQSRTITDEDNSALQTIVRNALSHSVDITDGANGFISKYLNTQQLFQMNLEDENSGATFEHMMVPNNWKISIEDNNGTLLYEGNSTEATVNVVGNGGESKLILGGDGKTTLDATSRLTVTTPYAYIQAPKIDLGEDDGDLEPVVLGDKLADWLINTLKPWVESHTHIGNLGAPTSGPLPAQFVNWAPVSQGDDCYSDHNQTQ